MEHARNYRDFVDSRVKWMPTLAEDLIHATVGIVGELIELRAATTRENILEELGDIEFYCVHYELAWARSGYLFGGAQFEIDVEVQTPFGHAVDAALLQAGSLLDLAKKQWVYNKKDLIGNAQAMYNGLRLDLRHLHTLLGVHEGTLRANNEAKLMLRYPRGYSDAAAQQRADKAS